MSCTCRHPLCGVCRELRAAERAAQPAPPPARTCRHGEPDPRRCERCIAPLVEYAGLPVHTAPPPARGESFRRFAERAGPLPISAMASAEPAPPTAQDRDMEIRRLRAALVDLQASLVGVTDVGAQGVNELRVKLCGALARGPSQPAPPTARGDEVEVTARAIYAVDEGHNDRRWDAASPEKQAVYRALARAAIRSLDEARGRKPKVDWCDAFAAGRASRDAEVARLEREHVTTLRQRYAVEEEHDALRAEVEGLRKALAHIAAEGEAHSGYWSRDIAARALAKGDANG